MAGEAGKKLEDFFGVELAAMKIYDASCPGYNISPARFYDDNEKALEDMLELEEEEEKKEKLAAIGGRK